MNKIDVTEKLQILSEKHINGNNNTLKANDGNGWNSFYVLQFYKTTGSVKDIAITGGDAAIYVNGSTVTLAGTVDVSGNEFGGIEVSQGTDVTEVPKLTVDGTLVFDDEETPAIWIDGKTTNDDWVVVEGLHEVEKSDDSQLWFVTTKPEEPDPLEVINNADNEDALKDALNTAEIKNVFDDVDYLDNFDEDIATLEAVQGLVDRTNAAWAMDADFDGQVLTVVVKEAITPVELEVDHSKEKQLPEFSVYADEENPYGDSKEDFATLGVTVEYNDGTWTIDFSEAGEEVKSLLEGIKFKLLVLDKDNSFGSMNNQGYLTVSEN
jgi:hypothetical protein